MRNGNRIARLAAVVTFVSFAACQTSEVTGPQQEGEGSVSANEASAITNFIVGSTFEGWGFDDVGGGGGGGASLRSGVPITIDYGLDVTTGCPLGGELGVSGAISGSIDDQTLAGNLSLDVATSATNCGFAHEEIQFTLNTNPDLVLSGGFAFDQGQLVGDATFTYVGTVLWATDDGRSGSCSYDVTLTADAAGQSVESGTVCGQAL